MVIIITQQISNAAPFEVKVHDELIADYEHSAFEIETNVFRGPPSYPIGQNVVQSRLELGYGYAKQSEIGGNLYLSHYGDITQINGGKLSHMFIPAHDESGIWHYGIKNEINYIKDETGSETTFYEFTPIIGLHIINWQVTLNPSIDITLFNKGTATLSPSAKIAYGLNRNVDMGIEYYVDNLPFKNSYTINEQPNTLYWVLDAKYHKSSFNMGIGRGLNQHSDNWVAKVISSFNFD